MTAQQFSAEDERWMQQALDLAAAARYRTKPNPAVGCVIVNNQHIIGQGATQPVGGAHAEVQALKQVLASGHSPQGATAYVTLEPCAHFGRTPPCANALVDAGIARVVMAVLDPNPQVAGKGLALLQQARIATTVGVLAEQATALNRGFLQAMAGGLPYVRLKIAASLDGRTAMASGESKWITGTAARLDVQHWRALSGAVISGIDTVLADNPLLNVRQLPQGDIAEVVQPFRVILDRQGRLPLDAAIVQQPQKLIVMTPYREDLAALGITQLPVQSLKDVLSTLKEVYQIYDVLVEAGATLSTAFLQAGVVDEVIQYLAPQYLGCQARPLNLLKFEHLSQRMTFKIMDVAQIGQDIRVRLRPWAVQS